MAFKAKDLEYDKHEPAFLRKLRGELKTGDGDEDEPVILDESGQIVEKSEFERRLKGDAADNQQQPGVEESLKDESGVGGEQQEQQQSERQKVTEIGSLAHVKKRKAGKVVVDDEQDEAVDEKAASSSGGKNETSITTYDSGGIKDKDTKRKDPPKKKGKKIKLSFDDADVEG
ncbi:hypothetical protein LTR47_006022 [Exophiala xenobiotica]|nr:hypothetical protein LTR47_006022 [Exophiala xenobiotica]KAK5255467.1 hypothetical protein LTS06_000488 [Exophiala xenobiotica]KAK5348693.1 hypothetical protein LTR61_007720 [Exophiala xenobiotica]KAK5367997.1 hypothetical protein LTS03_008141 [Exophiala xenobiotica]